MPAPMDNDEYFVRKGGKLIVSSAKNFGQLPAVAIINPKFPHNIGAALRACSCYSIPQLWYTGNRVSMVGDGKKYRLPREERMKGYGEVTVIQNNYFFEQFPADTVPVAIEVRENSESLQQFEHPKNALYVFGPEDGGLKRLYLQHCHRFVAIPARHCLNLAAAIYTVLYDRQCKLNPDLTLADALIENRGM